ncbi:MAG: peptide chain release factor N(5)-glutamine methyltransferase [Bacteroidales bacterium]|nr:peptide chain release factor N(5)-glutamine methyltransferase [Bacteroidales bacterium]
MSGRSSLREIINLYRSALKDLYPETEIRNFCFLSAEHLLNYSKIDFHTKAGDVISEDARKKFITFLDRLTNGEPIQYVLGETEFFGLKFGVDRRVLIPRPETEEMVALIIHEENGKGVDLLDIGTGSGCIAIALDRFLQHANVFACDVSEDILVLARNNNERNRTNVHFFRHNILDTNTGLALRYNVVVSNPPYVRQSEKTVMHKNVLEFEPETALFVPDDDPLLYYRHITRKAGDAMHPGGRLYLEINENYPEEIETLLKSHGYHHIELKLDINRKPRIIRAVL